MLKAQAPKTGTSGRSSPDLRQADAQLPGLEQRSPVSTNNLWILFFRTAGTTLDVCAITKRKKLGKIWTNFKKECPDLVVGAEKTVTELKAQEERGKENIRAIIALIKGGKNAEADALAKIEAKARKPFEDACQIALSACYYELLKRGADDISLTE